MTVTLATDRLAPRAVNPTPVRPPARPERLFAATSLLVFAGALLPQLIGGANRDQSDLPGLVAQGLLCLVAVVLTARLPGGVSRAVDRLDPLLLALLGVTVLSVAWSVDPALTARRAGAVVAVTAFGLWLAERWTLEEQLWLVLQTLTAAAVLSVLLAVVVPRYGVAPGSGGDWRGVFVQKNVLARVAVFGVLAGLLVAGGPAHPSRRAVGGCAALLSLAVVLKAGSVFALGSIAVVLGVAAFVVMLRSAFPLRPALGLLIVTAVVGSATLLWLHSGTVLNAAGRDSQLTGRVPLWTSVLQAVGERPLLGYGYGAFWQGWQAPSTTVLLQNPWGPPHAHNGVLESALGVGVVGTALWVAALWSAGRRGLRLLRHERTAVSAWPLGFVLLLASFNVTEVTTMANACFWALFVAVSAGTRRRAGHGPVVPSTDQGRATTPGE